VQFFHTQRMGEHVNVGLTLFHLTSPA
jgi:hypothetical protein